MMIDFKKTDEFYIPNDKAFVHGGRDHAEKILSEYNVKTVSTEVIYYGVLFEFLVRQSPG